MSFDPGELTEDDVVTIRKVLIKDIISDLRKLITTGGIYSSVRRAKDMRSNIIKIIDKLYQILNEEIS